MKCWIYTGSSLIGPFSDEKVAKSLSNGKQVIAFDNDQPNVSEIELTKPTVAAKK